MSAPASYSFEPVPSRVAGERDDRLHAAKRALAYGVPFLDDCLRGILPHDLVLLGAPTGMGKTEMAVAIASSSVRAGRRVAYLALEAEPKEIERRIKFSMLAEAALVAKHPRAAELNFSDWMMGRCEHIASSFDGVVGQRMLEELSGLRTLYRGAQFDQEDLAKAIEAEHRNVDLIVVDHLHYVDTDADENEVRALGNTVKVVRDVSLRVGKPVILVAHLRKKDLRAKKVIASVDDFHGSSNITKIATQVITIDRAPFSSPAWYLAPTLMAVLKDRRGGAASVVALTTFDRRLRCYAPRYTLGRLGGGDSEWAEIDFSDVPSWAKNHRPLPPDAEGAR